jgi:hypothetical protein
MCQSLSSSSFKKEGLVAIIIDSETYTGGQTLREAAKRYRHIVKSVTDSPLMQLTRKELVDRAARVKHMHWGSYSGYLELGREHGKI